MGRERAAFSGMEAGMTMGELPRNEGPGEGAEVFARLDVTGLRLLTIRCRGSVRKNRRGGTWRLLYTLVAHLRRADI